MTMEELELYSLVVSFLVPPTQMLWYRVRQPTEGIVNKIILKCGKLQSIIISKVYSIFPRVSVTIELSYERGDLCYFTYIRAKVLKF